MYSLHGGKADKGTFRRRRIKMSDDIVSRLRETTQNCDAEDCSGCKIETEALNEIELLRAEVERLDAALKTVLAVTSEAVYGE